MSRFRRTVGMVVVIPRYSSSPYKITQCCHDIIYCAGVLINKKQTNQQQTNKQTNKQTKCWLLRITSWTGTHNRVLIKELDDYRRRTHFNSTGVAKYPDLVEEEGLVPCGTHTLLDDTRTGTVAAKCHDCIRIRESRLVTGIHVSCLINVRSQLIDMNI